MMYIYVSVGICRFTVYMVDSTEQVTTGGNKAASAQSPYLLTPVETANRR